jgi:hypothetical protein
VLPSWLVSGERGLPLTLSLLQTWRRRPPLCTPRKSWLPEASCSKVDPLFVLDCCYPLSFSLCFSAPTTAAMCRRWVLVSGSRGLAISTLRQANAAPV